MSKRTRIVNDPADLVPLLHSFGSAFHKKVFDEVSAGWKTRRELEEAVGADVGRSLDVLRRAGLIESRWRMPEPGKPPEKEFRSSYTSIRANFQTSVQDLANLIMITFLSEDQLRDIVDDIVEQVHKGNNSIASIARSQGLDPVFLRGIVKRSQRLTVRGQRVEVVGA